MLLPIYSKQDSPSVVFDNVSNNILSWKEYCDERYIKFVYLLLKVTHTVALVISHNIVNKLLIIVVRSKTIYIRKILHVKAFLIRFLVNVPFS